MVNEPKNHHYVPKFYLKNFAFNEDQSLVYSMSKEGKILTRHKSINRICADENYNTVHQEKFLSQIEREYSDVLMEFINIRNHGDTHLLPTRDFIEFVCLLIGNNIQFRQQLSKLLGAIELKVKGLGLHYDISIDKDYRGRLDLSFAFSDAVFEEFHRWYFVLREVWTGQKVFITSDNPVSILNPANLSFPVKVEMKWKDPKIKSLDNESIPISKNKVSRKFRAKLTLDSISFGSDVVILFPITPSACLIGFSDSNRHARFVQRPIVGINTMGFINLVTFTQCNRAVYSHSKDLLRYANTDQYNFINYCEHHRRIPTFDFGIG